MSVVTRRAMASDWAAIESLLMENDLPLAGAREHLAFYWVATDGDDIVGTVGVEPYGADGLLRSVAVRPAVQARGIGKALVACATADGIERGLGVLFLLTTSACAYFEGQGFVVIDRASVPDALRASAEFLDACPASATCMRRRIA